MFRYSVILSVVVVLMCSAVPVFSGEPVELVNDQKGQKSSAAVRVGEVDGEFGIVVDVVGTDDLHYYASDDDSGMVRRLRVSVGAGGVTFGEPVFPAPGKFFDQFENKNIDVHVGNFAIFIPVTGRTAATESAQAEVTIEGLACTSQICLPPFKKKLSAELKFDSGAAAAVKTVDAVVSVEPPKPEEVTETVADETDQGGAGNSATLAESLSQWTEASKDEKASRSKGFYFLLALLAGLSINIMPCVLPVIPLIIMKLVSQARESGPRRVALGLSFCGGIVLFFAVFAAIAVAIKLSTGTMIDLNSLFRNPTAVIVLFLFIVFFALVFMDIVTLALPYAVTSRQGAGGGFAGSIGMGFFAGVLSTPCSGALLGAVLVWAQTQPLYVSSIAIVLMGVGMAVPYAVFVSVPSLKKFIPKPGAWMEIFKQAGGFLLLIIAVKFTLTALDKDRVINVLMYGVVFAFCVWMWGKWVSFSTPVAKKWTVRLTAVVIAVAAGFFLLPEIEPPKIQWQGYDPAAVQKSIDDGKPVLIKFTATWCTNCKIVDKRVYQQEEIARLVDNKGLLAIKADTTQDTYQATEDLKAVFGEAGNIPVTIILNPKDKSLTKLRGIFKPEELKEVLSKF